MKAIIVEDDLIVADHLKMILERHEVNVLGIIDNVPEAIESMENQVDFYFIDIRLVGEESGIEFGRHLNEKDIPFAYVSANNEISTLKAAAITNPTAYLTKPYKEIDIVALLEVYKARKNKDQIVLKGTNNKNEIVEVSSIQFCVSDGSYVEIFTDNKRYFERTSLVDLSEKLGNTFLRCHRSYLVNKEHIKSYNASILHVADEKIPISRGYKSEVQAFLSSAIKK